MRGEHGTIRVSAPCKKVSNNMFGFHIWELLIILGIVLLLFGARRLPEMGSALGQTIQMFKKSANSLPEPANNSEQALPEIPEKTTSDK